MFALEASERINMGARRSYSVIFAASFLIITLSLLSPHPTPPNLCYFAGGGPLFLTCGCMHRYDLCTGTHIHRARSSN